MALHSGAQKCSLLSYDAACNDTYIRHWYTVTNPQCFNTPEVWSVHVNVTKLTCVIGPTTSGHIIYAVGTTYLSNLTDSHYRF